MAKRTNKKVSKTPEPNLSDFDDKQSELIRKILHRIDVGSFAYLGGYIKLSSMIFLLEKSALQLRMIDNSKDNSIVSGLISQLVDVESKRT